MYRYNWFEKLGILYLVGLSRYEILLYHTYIKELSIVIRYISRYNYCNIYAKIVVYVGMIEVVLLLPNKRKRTKMKTMCTMYNEKKYN